MPILWRYALHQYFRIFSLSIFTFIAVLIISRFKDIARFTALTNDFLKTSLFLVYHIPTILPIAIPLSALFASFLLLQSLSKSFELTALQSSGISIFRILFPLIFFSALLSYLNFLICAEIAPYCRREGKTLIYQETSTNPLLLLQRQKLVKLKNAYLDLKAKNDEKIKDLILVTSNAATSRLNLVFAETLEIRGNQLTGLFFGVVSYLNSETGKDTLIIENQKKMSTSAPLLSKALKKNRPRVDINALSFKTLKLWKKPKAAFIESLRRISLSISVFTFTILGASFGIQKSRMQTKKNVLQVLFLTLLLLMSYLFGKELKNASILAAFTFFLPHLLLLGVSFFRLHRVSTGKAC